MLCLQRMRMTLSSMLMLPLSAWVGTSPTPTF